MGRGSGGKFGHTHSKELNDRMETIALLPISSASSGRGVGCIILYYSVLSCVILCNPEPLQAGVNPQAESSVSSSTCFLVRGHDDS